MPHLSPLNWLLTPLMLMFILILMSSILWWQMSPTFPSLSSYSRPSMAKKWNWW